MLDSYFIRSVQCIFTVSKKRQNAVKTLLNLIFNLCTETYISPYVSVHIFIHYNFENEYRNFLLIEWSYNLLCMYSIIETGYLFDNL